MFYVIRVRGWPALVWLEVRPPARRYEIVGRYDDVLKATAVFYAAVKRARATLVSSPPTGPGARPWKAAPVYEVPSAKTMSPLPPAARKRPTYDSPR